MATGRFRRLVEVEIGVPFQVLADDLLELSGEAPAMQLIAFAGQAGHPGVFAEIGGPDGRGRLGEDIAVPLDVMDDRPADVDFLFEDIHFEDELYVGAGTDVHDHKRQG